jgi:hypothetical protein
MAEDLIRTPTKKRSTTLKITLTLNLTEQAVKSAIKNTARTIQRQSCG